MHLRPKNGMAQKEKETKSLLCIPKYIGTSILKGVDDQFWIRNGCVMENEVVEVGDTFRIT